MIVDLALLATASVVYWAWKTRDPQAIRIGDMMAVLAALIGLKLLKGNLPLGLVALAGAGWWFWFRRGGGNARDMTREDARRLLKLPTGATPEQIRAAHRRLIARVHPDVGGSADLTRQVNAARDTLLNRRG